MATVDCHDHRVLDAVLAGLVTGWAIAIPIGAVGALLVSLTARSSWRIGVAAALGIATVDGGYAAAAVAGGTALAAVLAPVSSALRLVAAAVLLAIAALTAAHALRPPTDLRTHPRGAPGPARAYALFVAITAVNPTTVVYFAAVVLGSRHLVSDPGEGAAFVVAAFVASAVWQLTLVGGGAALGRLATGARARRVTGLASAAVIAALAVRTVLP